jgi:hypothetical protein
MLAEKGIISFGEAQRIITETKEDMKQLTATGKNENVPLWVQTLKMSGDIRIRVQTNSNNNDAADTHAERVRVRERVRFGFETMAAEGLKAAFGIATGAGAGRDLANIGDKNPTSGNHTFEAFNKIPIFLDYAYLQYDATDWMRISIGKVKSGLQAWMPSQLIWKGDVNPDGLAFNFTKKLNSEFSFFGNTGLYVLGESRKGSGAGSSLTNMPAIVIAQPGIDYKYDKFSAKVGIALHQFYLKDRLVRSNEAGVWFQSGRQTADYTLINPGWDLKYREVVSKYAVSLSGDYSVNVNEDFTNAEGKDKQSYIVCLGFGDDRVSGFGTWQVKGAYRNVGIAAMPLGFGNTDAYSANPGKGFEYSLTAGLLKSLNGVITFYDMTNPDGKNAEQLAQFDLVYKF